MPEDKNETKSENQEEKLTDEQILDAINSPSISINPNFVNLGKELLNGVKEWLDCYGLSRNIFTCRIPEPGEEIRYAKDEDVTAYIVNGDKNINRVKEGYHVYPLEFEVSTYLKLSHEKFNSADIAKKIVGDKQEQAVYALMYQEDKAAIKLLMEASEENETVTGNLIETLDGLIDSFDKRRLICDKILLNRRDIDKMKKEYGSNEKLKNRLDPVSQYELAKAGYVGIYRNTMIITTPEDTPEDTTGDEAKRIDNIIPERKPIALASPEYLGGMLIKVNLFTEPISEYSFNSKHVFGWFWYEVLSMLVINPNTVVLGEINY